MRYEWKSVLEYDNVFHENHALYGIPWVYESHHMHNFRFLLQVRSDSIGIMTGPVSGPDPKRKSGVYSTRSAGPNSAN